MQNWWLAIQPIVYIFSRWHFTQLSPDSISASRLSVSLFQSDDNEVGEIRFACSMRKHFSSSVISCVTFAFDVNHTLQLCVRAKCVNVYRTDCFWNSTWISKFIKFSENKTVCRTKPLWIWKYLLIAIIREQNISIERSKCIHENVRSELCDLRKCRSIEAALVSIYRGVTTNIVGAVFSPVVAIHHRRRRAATNVFIHGPQLISIHIGRRADGRVYNVQ